MRGGRDAQCMFSVRQTQHQLTHLAGDSLGSAALLTRSSVFDARTARVPGAFCGGAGEPRDEEDRELFPTEREAGLGILSPCEGLVVVDL